EILLHSSSTLPHPDLYEAACADLPCILNEQTIAVDPNPEGHVLATFTDPDGPAALYLYRATLQWGGSPSTAGILTLHAATGEFSVHANETPPPGHYGALITVLKNGVPAVAVNSDGRPTGPITADVLVQDAPLTATGASLAAVRGKAALSLLAT